MNEALFTFLTVLATIAFSWCVFKFLTGVYELHTKGDSQIRVNSYVAATSLAWLITMWMLK